MARYVRVQLEGFDFLHLAQVHSTCVRLMAVRPSLRLPSNRGSFFLRRSRPGRLYEEAPEGDDAFDGKRTKSTDAAWCE